MAPVNFKLAKRDDLTRRITFPEKPTWQALATKIAALYTIPFPSIGVAYLDADGDEITLSSQDELEDFYQVSFKAGNDIKFTVQNLAASRQSKSLPDTPLGTNPRNTFGHAPFDIEDDWQRLPTLSLNDLYARNSGPESTHAFVEVLDSDSGSFIAKRQPSDNGDDSRSTIHSTNPFGTIADKGKQKASSVSSARSIIADDTPTKHPVHVFDVGAQSDSDESDFAHSTPKRTDGNVKLAPLDVPTDFSSTDKAAPKVTKQDQAGNDDDDPPLPDLDTANPPLPSLTHDVATLLTTLTNVVTSHPEVPETFRTIMRNTASGVYWESHREAVSQAARNVMNSSAQTPRTTPRDAEIEAGKRVADALGGIFRSLTTGLEPPRPPPATSTPVREGPPHPWGSQPRPTSFNSTSFWYGQNAHTHPLRGGAPPPFGGPPPWSTQHSRPRRESWGLWRPDQVHIPPIPNAGHNFGPPVHIPPPPPPPMAPHFHSGQPPIHQHHFSAPRPSHPHPVPPPPPPPRPWASSIEKSAPTTTNPGAGPRVDEGQSKSPQDLKAEVIAAKSFYKAQKQKYRDEREERRKERKPKAQAEGPQIVPQPSEKAKAVDISTALPSQEASKTAEITQIVSNARGPYPQLEMVSVPRRNNTHLGHGPHSRRVEDSLTARTLTRIARRLADMGFTEASYPELPAKIRAQVPTSGVLSKDGEDDIVTNLLEEVLAMSPKPVASGSGNKAAELPPRPWEI